MSGQRTTAVTLWVGALAVAAVVAVLAVMELRSRGTSSVGGFTVANYKARAEVENTPAPDFELPSLDGGTPIALLSFRGQVVVLNFWASWCAPCRLEAPGLRRVSEAYRHQGVRFLGVDHRDDDAAGRAFVDEFRLRYPSVTDPSGSLAYDYELIGFPTTFIIDPAGTIRYRFVGYLDEDVLEKALNDVLSRAPS
ncbi:MAG TPA: TlpA disulfide reductase family protein [Actinomycetota bacterium]|jgi:DsbE subfamily thiol:disulfide oxidoreductase